MADRDRHGTTAHLRGELNGRAKLTDAAVVEIREKYKTGNYNQMDLAVEYGVARSLISHVVTGRMWSHVELPR